MAVAATETRQEMGRVLAEAIGQDPAVNELWVSENYDGLYFWLVAGPLDDEDELRLYGLYDLLDERFPGIDYQLHVLNERHYPNGARPGVLHGADRVPLRAS